MILAASSDSDGPFYVREDQVSAIIAQARQGEREKVREALSIAIERHEAAACDEDPAPYKLELAKAEGLADLSDVPLSPELVQALDALDNTTAKVGAFAAETRALAPLHRELCQRIVYLRDQLAVSPEGGSDGD